MKAVPDMPQPAFSNWEKADKADLVKEIKTLRQYVASLHQIVKDVLASDREKMYGTYQETLTLHHSLLEGRVNKRVEEMEKQVQQFEARLSLLRDRQP